MRVRLVPRLRVGLLLGALIPSATALSAAVVCSTGAAQSPVRTDYPVIPAPTQASIDRGLAWLASRQDDEGAFGADGYRRNVAVVSLATMAFLAGGDTPGRGAYGHYIKRSIDYVLKAADDSGFVCDPKYTSHGPMYDHGFATLLLAEVYGMSAEPAIREKLSRAVQLIIATQNQEGGWRYHPKLGDADISVTVSQVMSLRAARNAGIYVPSDTIDRSVDYIKRCQNPDGGFMYMTSGGPSKFPRTAAAIVGLYCAGLYDSDETQKALGYLFQHQPALNDSTQDTHTMYGQYYATLATWQAGGEHWQRWYRAATADLTRLQQPNGSWADLNCPEYGTAMACLVLQMPKQAVPIFQR